MKKILILITYLICHYSIASTLSEFEKNLNSKSGKGYKDAVVIFDKGIITHDLDDYTSTIYTHIKVKVFSKKGIEYYKTLTLNYNPDTTELKNLEGTVCLPDGTTVKVNTDDINKKEISKEYGSKEIEVNLAFPSVIKNAVIEYSFTYNFNFVKKIETWMFQHEFPVIYSEIKFIPSEDERFGYTNHMTRFKLDLKKEDKYIIVSAKNIAPFNEEEFSFPSESIKASMIFYNTQKFISKKDFWTQEGNLTYYSIFEQVISKNGVSKRIAKKNFKKIPKEKLIETIYNYVLKNYLPIEKLSKSEKRLKKKATRKLKNAYSMRSIMKLKYVPSFYMNLILANLIANTAPEAKVSYASYLPFHQGVFNKYLRTFDQFSEMMLKIEYNGKSYWMDISKRYMPFGMTDYGSRGVPLLVMGEDGSKFETRAQENFKNNLSTSNIDIKILPDETALISEIIEMDRHTSFLLRKILNFIDKEKIEDIFKENFSESENEDVQVNSWKFENIENINKPLILKVEYTKPYEFEEAGDSLLLKLKSLPEISKNPFNPESRKLPIIFDYPQIEVYNLTYHLPEFVKIKSTPSPISINHSIYTYNMTFSKKNEHTIKVSTKKVIEKYYFKQSEVQFLYTTFNKIMKANRTVIILEETEE